MNAGIDVFARAGSLVYPVGEIVPAADDRQTVSPRLREFTPELVPRAGRRSGDFSALEPAPASVGGHRSAVTTGADAPRTRAEVGIPPHRRNHRHANLEAGRVAARQAGIRSEDRTLSVARGDFAANSASADERRGARGARGPERAVRRVLVQAQDSDDRPLGRPCGPAHRALARVAADFADHSGPRRHARRRQEFPGGRDRHGRHRTNLSR